MERYQTLCLVHRYALILHCNIRRRFERSSHAPEVKGLAPLG